MGRPLVFALNGERVEVAQPDPAMTLLSYIRTCTPLRGTKLGCGEGACVCVVFCFGDLQVLLWCAAVVCCGTGHPAV